MFLFSINASSERNRDRLNKVIIIIIIIIIMQNYAKNISLQKPDK